MSSTTKKFLIIILTIFALGLIATIIFLINNTAKETYGPEVSGTTEDIFKANTKEILSNNIYDFLLNIKNGEYDEAYEKISKETKEDLLKNKDEMAIYCINNFLTSNRKLRNIEVNEINSIYEYEYSMQLDVETEDDEIGIVSYNILMQLNDGIQDTSDFVITFK